MEKKVLNLMFLNTLGRPFKIGINDPADDITEETVRPVMDGIVRTNVFASSGVLESIEGAKLVTTLEENII